MGAMSFWTFIQQTNPQPKQIFVNKPLERWLRSALNFNTLGCRRAFTTIGMRQPQTPAVALVAMTLHDNAVTHHLPRPRPHVIAIAIAISFIVNILFIITHLVMDTRSLVLNTSRI